MALLCVALGLTGAVCWGFSSLNLSRISRQSGFSGLVWMLLISTSVFGVLVAILQPPLNLDVASVLACAGAGVGYAAGSLGVNVALRVAQVGPVTALTALEGPIAAGIPLLFGVALSFGTAAGIVVAVAGTAVIAIASGRGEGSSRGVALAVASAGAFGVALWSLHLQDLNVLVALVIMRTTAVVCCLPFTRMRRPTRRTLPAILAAGVFDATGWLLFILAERAGSLPLAALCIAQAPVVATLAAWYWLSERPPALAVYGIAGIVAGISLAAVIP